MKRISGLLSYISTSDTYPVTLKKNANNKDYDKIIPQKTARVNINEDDISEKHLIDAPPSESGEPGMTIAEIEELNKQQIVKDPVNFIDTPPSEPSNQE